MHVGHPRGQLGVRCAKGDLDQTGPLYRRNLQPVNVGIKEVRGNLQEGRVYLRRITTSRLQGWANQLPAPAYRYCPTRRFHRHLTHPLLTLATLGTGTRPGQYGCRRSAAVARCGRETGATHGCTIGVGSGLRGCPYRHRDDFRDLARGIGQEQLHLGASGDPSHNLCQILLRTYGLTIDANDDMSSALDTITI